MFSSDGFLRLTSCTHRCLPAGDQLLLTTPSPKCHSTLLMHIRPQTPLHSRPLGPAPARGPETMPELSALHLPHERSAWVLGGSRWGDGPSPAPRALTCCLSCGTIPPALAPRSLFVKSWHLPLSGCHLPVQRAPCWPALDRPTASTPSPCLWPRTLLHLPGHFTWAARTRFHGRNPVNAASG